MAVLEHPPGGVSGQLLAGMAEGASLWLVRKSITTEPQPGAGSAPAQGGGGNRVGKRAEEQVASSPCQITILTSSIANKETEQKQATDGK